MPARARWKRSRHSIDLTYVGPGPALECLTKSNGAEVRLIAGSANGGAAWWCNRTKSEDAR